MGIKKKGKIDVLWQGGVRIAHSNMATQGVAGGSATVNSVRITVFFENKVHLKLIKEGCKAAP